MQQRQIFPWLAHDFTFQFSPLKKLYDQSLNTLHKFTKKVIQDKRKNYEIKENVTKGKVAFLDLLLQAELPDGSKLSDADIQEEVDTFMFEGHDTTACAISWCLYLLGKNPEVMKMNIQDPQNYKYPQYFSDNGKSGKGTKRHIF